MDLGSCKRLNESIINCLEYDNDIKKLGEIFL